MLNLNSERDKIILSKITIILLKNRLFLLIFLVKVAGNYIYTYIFTLILKNLNISDAIQNIVQLADMI